MLWQEVILYKDVESASGGAIKNSHIATRILVSDAILASTY